MFRIWFDGSAAGFADWKTATLAKPNLPQQFVDLLNGKVSTPTMVDWSALQQLVLARERLDFRIAVDQDCVLFQTGAPPRPAPAPPRGDPP